MQRPIDLILVSSRNISSDLLRTAFSLNREFRVVGQAESEKEALTLLGANPVDVVLIDEENSAETRSDVIMLSGIRRVAPSVRTIVLADKSEHQKTIEYFRNGARGLFIKTGAEFQLLCKCVDCVHRGQIWASSEELGWLIGALENALSAPQTLRVVDAKGTTLLSKREEDVVKLLMEGYSNRDIARSLDLSAHTIKNYLFRIFDKLGVSSRTELLLYALNSMSSEAPSAPSRKTANFDSSSLNELDTIPLLGDSQTRVV